MFDKESVRARIEQRRKKLGISVDFIASKCQITTDTYWDIETDPEEWYCAPTLGEIRCVCACLEMTVAEALGIPEEDAHNRSTQVRSELIAQRRAELGLSVAEFADAIWLEEEGVHRMEAEKDAIDAWPVELVELVATALGLPVGLLLEP